MCFFRLTCFPFNPINPISHVLHEKKDPTFTASSCIKRSCEVCRAATDPVNGTVPGRCGPQVKTSSQYLTVYLQARSSSDIIDAWCKPGLTTGH